MTGYTTVFGAQPIYSSQPSLLELALTADTDLDWPLETTAGTNVLATIIDVTPDAGARIVSLPDARQGTPGYAVTFVNLGAFTFTVNDSTGVTQLTVASGEAWTIYLRTNTTAAGTWQRFQQGAGTSSANAAGLAGAGLKAISTTLNTKYEVSTKSVNYVIVNSDRAVILQWTGGVGQFTLPDSAVVGTDWYCGVKNAGVGSLTVVPTVGLIDGAASSILATGESAFFYCDGTNFFTVGLGQEVNSIFDFIQINAAGLGDYTLAGVELNRISYRFTGLLTGNRNIVVPASVQQYWIDNETTGAFTLTVKTAAGTGKVVAQLNRTILYCDGTNVLDADSGSFTPPLLVASGGTGATTAANARANLGSTTVGDAVYIAVSATAARLALGATATGDAVFTAASSTLARVALGASSVGNAVFVAADAAAARTAIGVSASGVLKFKTVNTNRANNTLSDDPQLAGWALIADKKYSLRGFLSIFIGTAGPGVSMLLQMSNNPQYMYGVLAGSNDLSVAVTKDLVNLYTTVAAFGTASAADLAMNFNMIFQANAGVGGTLDFQWAQSVTNAVNTVLRAGSWLELVQLD